MPLPHSAAKASCAIGSRARVAFLARQSWCNHLGLSLTCLVTVPAFCDHTLTTASAERVASSNRTCQAVNFKSLSMSRVG